MYEEEIVYDRSSEWQYDYNNQDYLQSLLYTSTYEGLVWKQLERDINNTKEMNKTLYDELVFNLNTNQLDRITSGLPYNQGDIIKHLRKLK